MNQWPGLQGGADWDRQEILYNTDELQPGQPGPVAAIRVGDWKYIWREPGRWLGWYTPAEVAGRAARPGPGLHWAATPLPGYYPARQARPLVGLLYHLGRDPGETLDLAKQQPAVVERLQARILQLAANITRVEPGVWERTGRPSRGVWASGWC